MDHCTVHVLWNVHMHTDKMRKELPTVVHSSLHDAPIMHGADAHVHTTWMIYYDF